MSGRLVLSRRIGESIQIGADVTVTILSIKGNFVRLGCIAPREVIIDRSEVAARKLAEKGVA